MDTGETPAGLAHEYLVDGVPVPVWLDNASEACFGEDLVLSTPETDATASQPWYPEGFTVVDLFSPDSFAELRAAMEATLRGVMVQIGIDTRGFTLERYHCFVDDAQHYQIVGRTRDLFQRDVALDVAAMHARLGAVFGRPLTDMAPAAMGGQLHIILRVNRPGSTDFNPVHKDIYEPVDNLGLVPPLINFWVPIAGVGPDSALPIAPGSHRLNERTILRTRAGSRVEGRAYRVNSILEWDGSRSLERVRVRDGQVLIFSPHLIHGLAVNRTPDTTRVALEFRLMPA